MVEITVISGFLGAGKTTLINELLSGGAFPRRTLLVENEFGEIGIDTGLLEGSCPVLEISSGCICCSVSSDFVEKVSALVERYQPQALIIEPSGCADLEEFMKYCREVCVKTGAVIRRVITVVNAEAVLAQLELGGPFFRDQLAKASFLVLSCMTEVDSRERQRILEELGILNDHAPVCILPMDAAELLGASEGCVPGEQPREKARGLLLRNMGQQLQAVSIAPKQILPEKAEAFLAAAARGEYGSVLRIKGFVNLAEMGTGYLEYIPGRPPSITLREASSPSGLVIIGKNLDKRSLCAMLNRASF